MKLHTQNHDESDNIFTFKTKTHFSQESLIDVQY